MPNFLSSIKAIWLIKPAFNSTSGNFETQKLEILWTGFWVKNSHDNFVFITCAHVVQQLLSWPVEVTWLLVVGGNSEPYTPAKIHAINFSHDIAILQLTTRPNPDNIFIQISDREVVVSDTVSFAGYPLGLQLISDQHEPNYSEWIIWSPPRQDSNRKKVQISWNAIWWYSGSPIVLKDTNKLVGILTDWPQNTPVFWWTHFEHIANFINCF